MSHRISLISSKGYEQEEVSPLRRKGLAVGSVLRDGSRISDSQAQLSFQPGLAWDLSLRNYGKCPMESFPLATAPLLAVSVTCGQLWYEDTKQTLQKLPIHKF